MTLEQINERLQMLIRTGTSWKAQQRIVIETKIAEKELETTKKRTAKKAYWAKRYAIKKSGYSPKRRQIY